MPMEQYQMYAKCRLCPRECGVDRNSGELGFCGEGAELRLAFAGLHSGEEPPLSGEKGSGAVFVSGCNLRCRACQNWQISGGGPPGGNGSILGRAVSTGEFAGICMALQEKGAENINIVTGSHAAPAIAVNLAEAKRSGLAIPIVWNSSGYEKIEALELLGSLVDTWLPDLKTLDSGLAAQLCSAPDYPQAAANAISWMMRDTPGQVIIRHLILPGCLESTRAVLEWFANNAAGQAQLSLMSQYTPIAKPGSAADIPGMRSIPVRYISKKEYETVIGWLAEFGIDDGFCQELVTGSTWLPDFRRPNPFSSKLSVPAWHYS